MSIQNSVTRRRALLSAEQEERLARRLQQARGRQDSQIPRRADNAPPPLSFAQQRLWFLDQLVPGNPFYNIPAALPLHMPIDKRTLERTIQEIVQRHEILHTTFVRGEDGPVQMIAERLDLPLHSVDLSMLPPAERTVELQRLAVEAARTPFDLSVGPLLRTTLVTLGPTEQVFLLTLHHIIADGWSMGVFFRELMQLYEAFSRGKPGTLPKLPIQYGDFAVWQRQNLRGQEMDRLLSYWKRQLRGLPQLALITDRPRPPIATFVGAFLDVEIPGELKRRAETLARQQGCTLFQLLLTAFKVVLSRYSNQTDIVVGAPIANRTRMEIEGLIGFFVNNLVLRTDLSGDPTFVEALSRVRDVTLDAYAHQELPFEKLVEELQPERDLSRNPLCQVTFQIQNAPTATGELPAGAEDVVKIERKTALFDIAFSLWETQSGLIGGMEYSTDLFDEATISRIAHSFTTLLDAALANPAQPISNYPILTPAERRQMLSDWNNTARAFPEHLRLHHLVEQQVNRTPAAVAVLADARQLTYAELDRCANRLAHFLLATGIQPGDVVGLCMQRDPDMIVALLAILKAGAAFLPLDPLLPRARIAGMVEEARPPIILTHVRHADALAGLGSRVVPIDTEAGSIAASPATRPVLRVDADSLAYVLYTSGSTGRPKAVLIHHDAICNHMHWMRDAVPLRREDRLLQRTPFYFDASIWEFFAPLQSGATLVVPPPAEAADTGALIDAVRRHGVTILQLVPSLLRVLLDDPDIADCRSLRRVCCGGEPLTANLRNRFFTRFDAELWNLYGPTETTVQAVVWKCERDEHGPQVPIGRPIANTQVYILDPRGEPVPPGVLGEICIAGRPVGRGYLNAPDLTARRFGVDPFLQDGSRLFKTGDLGWYRSDGVILCAGRTDDQVKIRGNRIELGEVEAALRTHPAVEQAVVVTHPDPAGQLSLTAYVTVAAGDQTAFMTGEDPSQLDLLHEHVAGWQHLYEEIYADAPVAHDPTFNITGWTSSYTGQAIPAEEMRHWLDHTVARILALNPQRVIEIGCGTGLILFRVAPRCCRYFGFDFSRMAIQTLRDALARSQLSLPQVTLDQRTADKLDDLLAQSFDTIIMNSVVQYFPNLLYLTDVIGRLSRLLAAGGTIFIGDVRSLPLQRAFHASTALDRAQPESTIEALNELVHRAIEQDKELVIDPAFFWALPKKIPAITSVTVQLKRGSDDNELINYRYDVTLQVGGQTQAAPALKWLDWRREGFNLSQVSARLQSKTSDVLAIHGIPNRRTARFVRAIGLLADSSLQMTTGEFLRRVERTVEPGVDVEALITIGEQTGYDVVLTWGGLDDDGDIAAVYRKRSGPVPAGAIAAALTQHFAAIEIPRQRRLATNPMLPVLGPRLIPALRQHLQALVPDYMVPSRIEPIDAIPLKPNGKIDRAGLPPPVEDRIVLSGSFMAPETALQKVIAKVWSEVLRLKQVSIHDNFFTDLGGHSLLATQVVARLREILQTEVPLRLLFAQPSIEALARSLHEQPGIGTTIDQVAEMVLSLESMAEDEIDTLLSDR